MDKIKQCNSLPSKMSSKSSSATGRNLVIIIMILGYWEDFQKMTKCCAKHGMRPISREAKHVDYGRAKGVVKTILVDMNFLVDMC